MTPKYRGKIEKGKLTLYQKNDFQSYLKTLQGEVEMSVKKYRKTRSLEQNAWLWGVAYKLISEHTGHSPDEIHEYLKDKLGLKKLIVIKSKKGAMLKNWVIKSTTSYNTLEMTQYMNDVQQWAVMQLDLLIPDPNQVEENENIKSSI